MVAVTGACSWSRPSLATTKPWSCNGPPVASACSIMTQSSDRSGIFDSIFRLTFVAELLLPPPGATSSSSAASGSQSATGSLDVIGCR